MAENESADCKTNSNSMASELLDVLNPHPYNKVVSNLSTKCGVDLRSFNRTRLAKNYWVDTKRFLSGTNRVLPHGIFELFGVYSGQNGSTVREEMIVWAYDNFRHLETCTSIALRQRNITLGTYLENIRDERNPGDEIAIYILANMYRRHVFIYTKEWWWTTVMFVMPIDEKDVIVKCDLVLVYIKPGIYGEVKEIRAPTIQDSVSKGARNTSTDTTMNMDSTEGHSKSLEFTVMRVPSGPSKTAASRRIRQPANKSIAPTSVVPRRSPRKRKVMNYKEFVSGLKDEDHPDLTKPKRKRTRGNLKQPSRTRVSAQKKIQQARTQRLCSPPRLTRVTAANIPEHVTAEIVSPVDKPTNPDLEMNEAANTLLSLSGDVNRTTDELRNTPKELDMTNTKSELTRPPVALEVNVIIDPKDNSPEINPEQIIGSAIKEEYAKPVKQADVCAPEKTKKKVKIVSTKHFRMKSYKLKRKTEIKRRFKCRICPEILVSVHQYNSHYREKHPPLPCPHCTRSFNAPRYLSRHLYSHAEVMYECTKCEKGFAFNSELVAHNRKHINDNDYVCMTVNCGKRFKRDSELKAHVKAHRKTNIRCGHMGCTYSNKDIRNVRAHRKVHSEKKPYKCANCGKAFKWQQQKKRHLVNCK